MPDTAYLWPPLLAPGPLLLDEPYWRYPTPGAALPGNTIHLRLFANEGAPGRIAVITENRDNTFTTDAAPWVWLHLTEDAGYADMPLTLLAVYSQARSGKIPTVDQYDGNASSAWRPVSDIGQSHPDHDHVAAWWNVNSAWILQARLPRAHDHTMPLIRAAHATEALHLGRLAADDEPCPDDHYEGTNLFGRRVFIPDTIQRLHLAALIDAGFFHPADPGETLGGCEPHSVRLAAVQFLRRAADAARAGQAGSTLMSRAAAADLAAAAALPADHGPDAILAYAWWALGHINGPGLGCPEDLTGPVAAPDDIDQAAAMLQRMDRLLQPDAAAGGDSPAT